MQSPITKVIGSAVVLAISYASHCLAPPGVDVWIQGVLRQICLHYGVTFAAPKDS